MAHKHQRRIANFVLQPVVQLRIGLLNVSLSLAFVGLLGWYVYVRLKQFVDVVAALTEANDQIAALLRDYLGAVGLTALVSALVFVAINLAASIYATHRLVGPTVAFRRHIARLLEGDFKVQTTLRKGDAFVEVADDLNRLSEKLRAQKSLQRD